MTKKTAFACTLLFVFAFTFGFAFTLASSAQAEGGGCCLYQWCEGHVGSAIYKMGHRNQFTQECEYDPPHPCDYTYLCPDS